MAFKHHWNDVEGFVLSSFEGTLPQDFSFKGYVHSSPWHRSPRMVEEFGTMSVLLIIRSGSATVHYMGERIHDYHETGSVSFNDGRIVVGFTVGFGWRATVRRLEFYTRTHLPPASKKLTFEKVSFASDLRMRGDKVNYCFVDALIEA